MKDLCTRPFYSGKYKMTSKFEFFGRIKKMIVDLVAKSDKEWTDYISRF
jgi:hypothetical protein